MLGPMGAYVISALRVMTPSEIDRYAKSSDKNTIRAVAAGAEDFDLSNSQSHPQGSPPGGKDQSGFKPLNPMSDAEIIPIDSLKRKEQRERKEGQREHSAQAGQEIKTSHQPKTPPAGNSELESLGIFSADKVNAHNKAMEEAAKASDDSPSIFLLKQRERLKKTNTKIIGHTALKNYTQAAHVEMAVAEPDMEDPDQELAHGSKGILVNKKHY